jgi:hypothetical protein
MTFAYYGSKISLVVTGLGLSRGQVGWLLGTWEMGLSL